MAVDTVILDFFKAKHFFKTRGVAADTSHPRSKGIVGPGGRVEKGNIRHFTKKSFPPSADPKGSRGLGNPPPGGDQP